MAENATVQNVTQIGWETTPGTLVAATRRLGGASINLDPDLTTDTFVPEGYKFPTLVSPVMEFMAGDIEGRPCYNELVYFLAMALKDPGAPTQIMDGATPTGGYTWTFTPSSSSEDARKSGSLEKGSSFRAINATYLQVDGIGISLARDSAPELSGSAFAQRVVDPGVLTTIGSPIDPVPVLITHVDVYMDSTSAGLGTTKLTRLFSGDWSLGNLVSGVWPIDSTKTSYAATVEREVDASWEIAVEHDTQGAGIFTPLRAGDTRFFRIKAVGPNIYTGGVTVNHQLQIDFAAKVSEVGGYDEVEGVRTIGYTWDMVHDATWGKALTIQLINKLSSL